MKKALLFLAALSVSVAFASDNLRVPNIKSLSMGGSGVVLDALSNPSMMEWAKDRSVGIEYFNRYGLKELGTVQGYFLFPNPYLSAGMHLSSFGYEQYRMVMGRCLLSKRLNKWWSLGIAFQYAGLQSELYEESPARISIDMGVVYKPFENLLMALSVKDLPSFRLSAKDIDINEFKSYRVEVGFNWQVMNDLWITSFGAVDDQHDVMAGAGMEYKAYSCFTFRAGVQTLPLLPTLGVGFCCYGFQLDIAAIWHPELGINSGVGLSYAF